MKTQSELRAFALGTVSGIAIFMAVVFVISRIADIRWQLVSGKDWRQMQADRHYGCTRAQQALNGECQ